ncbi:MAG: hypothetical protein ACFB0A_13460 [Croceivirga sp.]
MKGVNRRILLVEDEQSIGYLLKKYLGMNNFVVTWAKDGLEALRILEERSFD